MTLVPRKTASGRAYVNVGCGAHYHREWNNLDLYSAEHVVHHDVRQPLPYEGGVFDGAYSSHVLEHLVPADGARLVREMFRVLKPGGVVRVAVPDLERICEEYLARLSALAADPSLENRRRYHWIRLEMFDQMVREASGGEMLKTLQSGDFDAEYVEHRNGDEFKPYYPRRVDESPDPPAPVPNEVRREAPASLRRSVGAAVLGVARALRGARPPAPPPAPPVTDPRLSGEAHKWMYDRVSLAMLLEQEGFRDCRACRFDESRIPGWGEYRLDTAESGDRPRKPDSLYVEAVKAPAGGAHPSGARSGAE